jgi:uncharacterized membrane protein YtjA (UPF0391 family)
MWVCTATVFAIAIAAELAGFGGIPAKNLEIENVVFIVLLCAFVAVSVRRLVRR